MAGTRGDGKIGEPTILQFQFLKNQLPYDPASIVNVKIFDDYNKALANNPADVLQTIPGAAAVRIGTGLFEYSAMAMNHAGTFFDRMELIPEVGGFPWSAVHPFYVRNDSYGSFAPGEIETCRVRINLFDFVSDISEARLKVVMSDPFAWYGKDMITNDQFQPQQADQEGTVIFNLVETTTMSVDTGKPIYYTVNIGEYTKRFTVPKGTLEAPLKDLPVYV